MNEGFLKVIRWVLVALGVMLLLAVVVLIFTRPSSQSNNGNSGSEQNKPLNLQDYRETGSMRLVQNGRVTAPENHFRVVITVTNSSRTIDIYNGYDTPPSSTQSYANNQTSFDAFLGALQGNGFTNAQPIPSGISYETYCTAGVRYSYQILTGDSTKMDNWNSSCNPKNGSFAGSSAQVQQLFRLQIPDYNQLTSRVRL